MLVYYIALHSTDDDVLTPVHVKAYLKSIGPREVDLEQIVTRPSIEAGVTAISWEVVASVNPEDASLSSTQEEIFQTT